jgi:FtsP/CotA-like multicopper oxidase with cupredoxin domain
MIAAGITTLGALAALNANAQVPGGTLNPTLIPKYVTPLVVPPEMPASVSDPTVDYQIAVRQFQQQVLPPTDINGNPLPLTTVWGYGSVDHPGTVAQGGTFYNPAFTIEATKDKLTRVKWINDLTDPVTNTPLPHLFDIDRTLHWANPELATCADGVARTDCRPDPLQGANAGIDFTQPYTGPVPMIIHVHGAHTDAAYDGYAEAWYLPASANGLVSPVTGQPYAIFGDKVNKLVDRTGVVDINTTPGQAIFDYLNDQPSTTLWYHDHSLGMTRLNVAAAAAGFYLIREPGKKETGLAQFDRNGSPQRLPCCAPRVGDELGKRYYEIPVVVQDRSFNADGSMFYPADRAFFEGLSDGQVAAANPDMIIDFIDDPRFTGSPTPSDISPIWNPEAFFNTMVVNGATWPFLDVEPRRYRLRLLNAADSRFLNLTLRVVVGPGVDGINGTADDVLGAEIPFYMIGSEQGLLPDVVEVTSGQTRTFLDDGTIAVQPTRDPLEALLMGPAERPDVIVDFTGLAPGTVVRMMNTAPDAPFGGFPDVAADPGTTGQVMEFRVNLRMRGQDNSTPPQDLVLIDQTLGTPAPSRVRTLALLEEGSGFVCVAVDAAGEFLVPIQQVAGDPALDCADAAVSAAPFGPQAAVLGNVDGLGFPTVQLWSDAIHQNPVLGATEEWQFWNFSADAHPIHVHQVGFEVLGRQALALDPATGETAVPGVPLAGTGTPALPWETGFKDTVTALPGEITRIKATFDLPGLYVWHCHILSHEDNEMMVPFCVGDPATGVCSGDPVAPGA